MVAETHRERVKGMDVFGWVLFVIGASLLIVFAFIGIDGGGIAVGNLPGTLVGSAMMISGAVFVGCSRIEQAFLQRQSTASPQKQSTLASAPPSSSAQNKASGHIKNYKGYELTRGEGGVYVNGNKFSNVLAAEKWVNEQVKMSQ